MGDLCQTHHCCKCSGEGTRAHHRRCQKRGNREQMREAFKRWWADGARAAARWEDSGRRWVGRPSEAARLMADVGSAWAQATGAALRPLIEQQKRLVSELVSPHRVSTPAEVRAQLDGVLESLGADGFVA